MTTPTSLLLDLFNAGLTMNPALRECMIDKYVGNNGQDWDDKDILMALEVHAGIYVNLDDPLMDVYRTIFNQTMMFEVIGYRCGEDYLNDNGKPLASPF